MLTCIALVGVLTAVVLTGVSKEYLGRLIFLATGALLAVTLIDILPDAKELLSWSSFILFSGAGFLILVLIRQFIFHVCPACAYDQIGDEPVIADRATLILMAVALAIHCSLDGLAIAAGLRLPYNEGLGMLIGLGIHKLPEGLALGLMLLGSGYNRTVSICWALAIELMTLVGGVIGLAVLNNINPVEFGSIFGFVGGGFLYLVLSVTFGELRNRRGSFSAKGFGFIGVGLGGTSIALFVCNLGVSHNYFR